MNAADCSPVGRGTREAAARPRVRKILSEGGPGRRPSRSLRPRHGVPTMPSQRRPSPARAVSRPRGPRRAADPPDRRPDARRRPGAAPRSRPLRSDGPERSRAPRADAGEIDHESITTVRGAGTRPRRERRRAIVNCPPSTTCISVAGPPKGRAVRRRGPRGRQDHANARPGHIGPIDPVVTPGRRNLGNPCFSAQSL